MDLTACPIELGSTLDGTDSAGNLINTEHEGKIFRIPDKRITSNKRRSNHPLTVMVVRNVSGITLYGKRIAVLKKDGGVLYGSRVDGYAAILADPHAVPIDDQLPSTGVANNDLFLVILHGHYTVLTDFAGAGFNGDIAVGAALVAATFNGSTSSSAGRVSNVTLAGQTAGTASFNMARNILGTALSARTTGETHAELLMYNRNNTLI